MGSTRMVDPLSILDGTLGHLCDNKQRLQTSSATTGRPPLQLQASLATTSSNYRPSLQQLQASSATTSSTGANPNSFHEDVRDIEDSMTLALAQAPIFARTAASAAARMCRQFAGVFSMSSLNKALAEQQASLQDIILY